MQYQHETQLAQALHNVGYHPPKDATTGVVLADLRTAFKELLYEIDDDMPDGREKALCYTHIEEACMYAMAAVVRNQPDDTPEELR